MKKIAAVLCALALLAGCSSGGSGHPKASVPDCRDPSLSQAQWTKYCGPVNLGTEPVAPGSTSPASGVSTEGSVKTKNGSFVEYPDGAVVRITKAETLSSDRCYEPKATQACILIQATLTNKGAATIVFGNSDTIGDPESIDLYYGANRYKADTAGFMDDPGLVKFPKQCVPGSKVTTGQIFLVPDADTTDLAVTFEASVSPDRSYTPYTFDDVQTLLT